MKRATYLLIILFFITLSAQGVSATTELSGNSLTVKSITLPKQITQCNLGMCGKSVSEGILPTRFPLLGGLVLHLSASTFTKKQGKYTFIKSAFYLTKNGRLVWNGKKMIHGFHDFGGFMPPVVAPLRDGGIEVEVNFDYGGTVGNGIIYLLKINKDGGVTIIRSIPYGGAK